MASDFDPDSFLAGHEGVDTPPPTEQAGLTQAVDAVNNPVRTAMPASSEPPGDFNPDDFLQDAQEERYGGLGEQLKTGAEGLARGVAGPLATGAERLMGAKPEDIRGRQETNPITAGVGETVGLGGSLLTGVGEGALMVKAGEGAAALAGLGQVAKDASLGYKVGSAAVKGAAEMAVLSSGDEAHKMIVQDPDASAQSALANIGMAAAFGGAGGAFFSGVVNPLWEATGGPKLTEMLSGLHNHANGTPLALPAERDAALKTLGIEITPEMRAGLSGDAKASEMFNHLREAQNPEILNGIEGLKKSASDSVMQSLSVDPEMVANYSENATGHAINDMFQDEYKRAFGPVQEMLEERNANAAPIATSDQARMAARGQLIEKGMETFSTGSPMYDVYDKWSQRLLDTETIGAMDKLKTELGGELNKAYRAGDSNMIQALGDIKSHISNFQEDQILKQSAQLEKEGAEHGLAIGKDIVAQRAAANASYSGFSKMSNELAGHLGIPDFKGFGRMSGKIGNDITPELLAKKFSPKNNADIIPFLEKYFPHTAQVVRQNEAAQIIKSAVTSAKGEQSIDMNKLQTNIRKLMAGKSDYVKWAMPAEALQKIQAADVLSNSLPNFKSSGTAGWMMKMVKHVPMSGMAMVGMMTGHNPVMAGIMGEIAEKVGVGAPNAVRLAHLKFMGSTEPISSQGFKSMVEYMHNTIKGDTMMAKGTKAIFKSGAQVLTADQMPSKADRDKLDKVVEKSVTDSSQLLKLASGHTGHYMPEHQQAMAQTSQRALGYLASLKPQPMQSSPLDKPIPPSDMAQARYDRALNIAQQPAVVLAHIKNGTLQPSDVADMKAMYPAIYDRTANRIAGQLSHATENDNLIPYHTKVSVSMFLGQPMDSTMTPQSIMSAQASFQPTPPPGGPPQQGRPSAMKDKSANKYKTASQEAESDRSNRD